jgi:7-cyano-7-deazaguanine synthase in queuosine biosynthesis
MSKIVLLNSGGLDSAMIAKYLQSQEHEVHSLFIDSKQINREATMLAAQETADRYCNSHKILEFDLGMHSNIYDRTESIAMYDNLTEEERRQRSDRVGACPALGLLFTSMGTAYAISIMADVTIGGFKGNFNTNMTQRFNDLVNSNTVVFYKGYLKAPLTELTDYTSVSDFLGVDFSDLSYTHSCLYNEPCGVCTKCLERSSLGV